MTQVSENTIRGVSCQWDKGRVLGGRTTAWEHPSSLLTKEGVFAWPQRSRIELEKYKPQRLKEEPKPGAEISPDTQVLWKERRGIRGPRQTQLYRGSWAWAASALPTPSVSLQLSSRTLALLSATCARQNVQRCQEGGEAKRPQCSELSTAGAHIPVMTLSLSPF